MKKSLRFGPGGFWPGIRLRPYPPGVEVARVQRYAEQICGDKSELCRADANHTHDGAINGGNHPALPQSFPEQDRTEDGQDARDVIQSKELEHVEQFV